MAGMLEVLVTPTQNARTTLELLPNGAQVVPLDLGFSLIPLTSDLKTALRVDESLHLGFDQLSRPLANIGRVASERFPVAYCHLEFHGGLGFHAAVVWRSGAVEFGPLFTANARTEQLTPAYLLIDGQEQMREMAINAALRHMGAETGDHVDEFEAVGLDRHRWTEDWLPPTA